MAQESVIEKINLVGTDMLKKLLLLALLAFSINILALEPDTQAAKDEGMRLYGIGISAETIPYLEPAAEAGDVEAMYYLGEVHRLRNMGLTTEAMEWYLQAAEQGDVYAMLRLFQGGACTAGDECPEGYDDWHYAALDISPKLKRAIRMPCWRSFIPTECWMSPNEQVSG